MSDLAYWPSVKPLSKKDKFAKNRDFIKNLDHKDKIWEKLKIKFLLNYFFNNSLDFLNI